MCIYNIPSQFKNMENSELVVFIGSALLCRIDKMRAHAIYVLLFIVFIFTIDILLLRCKFSLVSEFLNMYINRFLNMLFSNYRRIKEIAKIT